MQIHWHATWWIIARHLQGPYACFQPMTSFPAATSRKSLQPRVPEGIRVYAVGDIHGRADLLEEVLKRIDADLARSPPQGSIEIFLGDYIDRGPASRQVLDRLIERQNAGRSVFLKGNHETYMIDFAANPLIFDEWKRLGGLETLLSYGLAPSAAPGPAEQIQLAAAFQRALPESHRRFLDSLKLSYTCGDYFFVHAGIRPGIPLKEQHESDLLWIRRDFLLSDQDFSKIIVHGHSRTPEPDIRPNRINIDTGAYTTGRLTCLVLENDQIDFI